MGKHWSPLTLPIKKYISKLFHHAAVFTSCPQRWLRRLVYDNFPQELRSQSRPPAKEWASHPYPGSRSTHPPTHLLPTTASTHHHHHHHTARDQAKTASVSFS
ncbi:hypothetical protein E2C01_065451 [Portunus trituberculatus]|uniref:Uncharacterized protein n=1 Tax=Portunus trituberculatus TaxID=210409 RepID=A0A5B7HN66_PORTR|nr:hypothetical protein [Portunus trituberculatus]